MNKKDKQYLDSIENRKYYADFYAQKPEDDDVDYMEIYNDDEKQ